MSTPVTTPTPGSPLPPRSPVAELWARFLVDLRLHGSRWLRCDFTRMSATADERRALASARVPIVDAVAQDYVAWRHSMAWMALGFALIGTLDQVVHVFTTPTGGDTGITGFATLLQLLVAGSHAVLVLGLFQSLRSWPAPGDRQRLRLAWAIALYVPIVLTLLPLSELLIADPQGQGGAEGVDPGVRQVYRDMIGLLLGISTLWASLPGLLSVFPGTIRAGIILKTLLPGRSTGPVVALTIGPMYGLLLLVVFATSQQIANSLLFLLGGIILIAAPFLSLRPGSSLIGPLSREEVGPLVARYRTVARWANAVGLALILVSLFTTKLFGQHVVGFGKVMFEVHAVLLLVVWFLAMLTTFTVVSADALLQAMHRGDALRVATDASAQARRDTDAVADLEATLGVPTAPAPPPP